MAATAAFTNSSTAPALPFPADLPFVFEFCGTDALKNTRAEAIPGATQLEWIDLIEKDSPRFKSPEEMKKLFDDSGIKLDRPTAHCQSGGRASVMTTPGYAE